MNKILAVMMMAMAVLNVQAATHAKVQLWEGGPYWATTNIGAENPEDYGLYFWWGDTTGHRPSSDGTFSFSFDSSNCPTYNKNPDQLQKEGWVVSKDGTYVLAPAHDAAQVKWGGGWRMPTHQELYDLCYNKCDWTWTTMNGVNGYVIRGRGSYASNSIFLPCAGYSLMTWVNYAGSGSDSDGSYWSSVPSSDYDKSYANTLGFGLSGRGMYGSYRLRWFGLPVRPVQGFGEEADCIVYFNSNGGTGTMEEQTFEVDKEQKLLKNLFKKDGYVFQGWAETTDGSVKYTDEQEITVDSDMTLYAVWDNPPLTLTAESANWSSGAITLKCEDSDTSGAEHMYSLEYKNESGVWTNVNDVAATSIARSADGFAHLTDTTFWSRLGGIPPVEYRVKDENGRVSAECVTRNRFLLSVGYSDFLTKNKPKDGHYNDAIEFRNLCVDRGGFQSDNAHFISNADATTVKVRNEMYNFAALAKPGDLFVFYISTHGGDYDQGKSQWYILIHSGDYDNGHQAGLATYDSVYRVQDLLTDVRNFSEGTAVINVIMSCHSFALTGGVHVRTKVNEWLVKCGFGQCLGNVAWVTSCDTQQNSYTFPDENHSRFGQSFIVNGFGLGSADTRLYGMDYDGVDSDGYITFGELYRYARTFFTGLSDDLPSTVQGENEGLLDRIVVGRNITSSSWGRPGKPTNVVASQGNFDRKVKIDWSVVSDAQSYRIYRYDEGIGVLNPKWVGSTRGAETSFTDEAGRDLLQIICGKRYCYCVRSVNPVGMSEFSTECIGWRGTVQYLSFLTRGMGTDTASADEYDAQEKVPAANGCRTVGECYALGINPEDPNDDLKISHFEMKDGKPVITLNHTEDGSGNSFVPRVKTLGKASLSDAEWREVPEDGDPTMRFFKVSVELP